MKKGLQVSEYGRRIWLIFRKDLRVELLTSHNFISTAVFGIMLVVIFSFAFQLTDFPVDKAFGAVIWVSVFFTSTLSLQRLFGVEEENDALSALLLAVGDRGSIFLAKMLANLTVLLLLEMIILPPAWILINARINPNRIGFLIAALFLGSWGLAAVGTVVNALAVQVPNTRLLFPILLFPLLLPILIGGVLCVSAALDSSADLIPGWLYLMLCFDLIYTVVPFVLFDWILEG
ncbi:MAG: heme exporter protein CcmB [Candidatus Wallacebacter cryptica]|nr:ABC transporter permease [Bacillota bacterium]